MVPFAQHALAAIELCGRRSGACKQWRRRVGKALGNLFEWGEEEQKARDDDGDDDREGELDLDAAVAHIVELPDV